MKKQTLLQILRISAISGGLLLAIRLMPDAPIDPWQLISLKKILTFAAAITIIQLLSIELAHMVGRRHGAILTGLLGGFVSSTATVLTLARASNNRNAHTPSLFLSYVASTVAMQVVCVGILFINSSDIHYPTLLIMVLPLLSGIIGLVIETSSATGPISKVPPLKFAWDNVLKLTAFIVLTLLASKMSQRYFQESGTMLVTFVVSLFEMHGSIIANLQLHDAGAVDLQLLGALLALSVLASFTSKLAFVLVLGGAELKQKVLKYTALAYALLATSWLVFAASVAV